MTGKSEVTSTDATLSAGTPDAAWCIGTGKEVIAMKKKMDGRLAREFDLLAVVNELRKYDHIFLNEKGVERFAKPFGLVARCYEHRATPNEPKGLTLKNGAESAVGLGAHELAMEICEHVGVEYEEKFGRGSQLRVCCDALEAWLKGR